MIEPDKKPAIVKSTKIMKSSQQIDSSKNNGVSAITFGIQKSQKESKVPNYDNSTGEKEVK